MRRTVALSCALSLSWMGLAIAPITRLSTPVLAQTTAPQPVEPPTPDSLPTELPDDSPVTDSRPSGDRVDWTNDYATALEDQTDLVLTAEPLDSVLTRIELAQWLTEFFDYRADPEQAVAITDMQPNTPDFFTAQAVMQGGIMRAFDGDQFRPDGDVTKLEAIAIMVRALELQPPNDRVVNRWLALYDDSDAVPEVGYPFIAMAGEAGLIVNVPDPERLNPNLILSRGEGAVLLHQALLAKRQVSDIEPPIAQVAPQPLPKPEIASISVSPETGSVGPGESLIVEVEGTPNAQGAILLAGSIQQSLQEVEPGLYRAEYTVTPQDAIANPSVAVRLDLNGEVTRSQRQLPELALGNALTPAPTDSPESSNPSSPNTPPSSNRPPRPPRNAAPPPPIATNPSLPARPPGNTPAPPAVANAPTFTSIFVSPRRDLRVGDIFTVGIQGDPGAVAMFDLGDFAIQQPMQEIRPGVYEGTYAIATNDFAQNPELTVTFSNNNRGAFHAEVFPFSINTVAAAPPSAPPVSSPPVPEPDPQAASPAPANPLTGPSPLPANPASEPPTILDPSPGVQPLIFASSSNANGRELRPNDFLEVTMRGEQGARAAFRIPNVIPDTLMTEVAPGIYEGRIRISGNTPAVRNGLLQVVLEKRGVSTTRTLPESVTISPVPNS
ncbi:MAG: S-layer protein [Cyanobacteria bacterium J06597_1]